MRGGGSPNGAKRKLTKKGRRIREKRRKVEKT